MAVMDQFQLLYPDAKNIIWYLPKDEYRVEFKNNKMSTKAILGKQGSVIRTETEIRIIALPPEAIAFIEDEMQAKKIDFASIMEDMHGQITFKALANEDEYCFDANGHFIAVGIQALTQGSK